MKFLARRAFVFSFVILFPFLGVLNRSKIGNIISYNDVDTTGIDDKPKVQVKQIPNTDSVMIILIKQANNKLDTGLQRQYNYIQAQNFQAQKLVEMSNTINMLNEQLKIKAIIPNQVLKDAQKGNTQKEIFKMILIITICMFLIIGLLVAILVFVKGKKINQPSIQ